MSLTPREDSILSFLASPSLVAACNNFLQVMDLVDQYDEKFKDRHSQQEAIANVTRLYNLGKIDHETYIRIIDQLTKPEKTEVIDISSLFKF